MTSSSIAIVPLATDNVDESPNVTCSHNTGDVFDHGVTLVTCTAVDQSGNQVTCSFYVTVLGKNCVFSLWKKMFFSTQYPTVIHSLLHMLSLIRFRKNTDRNIL